MDDLDFALRISPSIGEIYSEAKRSSLVFPKHTLTQLRALAVMFCDMLAPGGDAMQSRRLDEKISDLYRAHRINPNTRDLLKQLQRWGNQAAHPEESLLKDEQFAALALSALSIARELLELMFQHIHGGAAIPAFELEESTPEELKEACYRAVIGNSGPDQYRIAMHFLEQAAIDARRAEASALEGNPTYELEYGIAALKTRALDFLGYASDGDFPPASYEYGLALANGARGAGMVPLGRSRLARARRDGDIDALAWCGQAALLGIHDYEVDYDLARSYLNQAANEDHPAALTLLADMYREGLGVPSDAGVAFGLTMRAAQAGFPQAQWQVAMYLLDGNSVQRDEEAALHWLREASASGQAYAQLRLAKHMRVRKDGNLEEITLLLVAAAQKINRANFELASLYFEHDNDSDFVGLAADRLQHCYETALNEKDKQLADACWTSGPGYIAKLEAARSEMTNPMLITRFLFDERGYPYPKRAERTRLYYNHLKSYMAVKGNGSHDEARLLGLLTSSLIATPSAPNRSNKPALQAVQQRLIGPKVGRNALCPCGCGAKAKACRTHLPLRQ